MTTARPRPYAGFLRFALGATVVALLSGLPLWKLLVVLTAGVLLTPLLNGMGQGYRYAREGYVVVNGKVRQYQVPGRPR